MKNSVKLSLLGLALSAFVVACGDGDKAKSKTPDSLAVSKSTVVTDSLKKDTAGNVMSEKKDSTVTEKSAAKKK